MIVKATDEDCLRFIRDYVTKHGYAPSVREITAGVGLSSFSATSNHLAHLEKAGLIRRKPGVPRALVLVA